MIRSGASAPWGLDGGRGAVPRKVFEKDNGVKIPLPVRPCGDGTASQPRAERRRVVATRLSHHATAVVLPQLLLNREELLHLRVVSGQGSGLCPQKGSIPRRGTRSRGSLPRPHAALALRHRVAKKKDPVCDGDALPAREGPARQQRRLHHVGARRRKDEPVLALEMRSRRWTPPRSPGRRRRAGWTYGHGLPAGSVVWYAPCLWQGGAERRDEPGAARVLRAEDLGRCERQAGGRWLS